MLKRISLLFIIFVLASCHTTTNKGKHISPVDAVNKIQPDTMFPVKFTTTDEDTFRYNYNYDSTESVKENLYNGWLDTFTIDGRKFMLKYDTKTDSINIQYLLKGVWYKNTAFEMKDQFETTFDCNYDGRSDLYSQTQGWNFVNFYLPAERLFSKQYQQPGDHEILLDSSNKLCINYREPYHICNRYVSQLIDYKKEVPTIHYVLEGETYVVDDMCVMDSIKTIKLYKYDSIKDKLLLLQTMKPKTPKSFSYEEFWYKNYKQLMGYANTK